MARKGTGGKAPRKQVLTMRARVVTVWHPALIVAAEDGGTEQLAAPILGAQRWLTTPQPTPCSPQPCRLRCTRWVDGRLRGIVMLCEQSCLSVWL